MTTAPQYVATSSAASCPALLAETYRRLIRVCESLRADVASTWPSASGGSADGWIDGAELVHRPELIDALIDAEAARIRIRYEDVARRDVAASRALHHYLWSVCLLMSGPWYLERRVPRVRPQDVRFDLMTGAVTVVPSGFTCLPGDVAAGLPGARVVAHEEALRAELRASVADHVGPLLTAMAPQLRRGSRALWGMVGDDLVSGIWYLGRMLDQEEQSVRDAGELLPGAMGPFPGGADFRQLLTGTGEAHMTRTRLGCCLLYTIRSAEACVTCPRTCDAQRLRRIEGA